jgi:hypothetical protein
VQVLHCYEFGICNRVCFQHHLETFRRDVVHNADAEDLFRKLRNFGNKLLLRTRFAVVGAFVEQYDGVDVLSCGNIINEILRSVSDLHIAEPTRCKLPFVA